jgi:hypothetical protein
VNERTYGDVLQMSMQMPELDLSAQTLDQHVTRKTGDSLAFVVKARQREFELIPYYRIAHERYNLYWQCRT